MDSNEILLKTEKDLTELENSYYQDLKSNKNNISYWYPKIKNCGIKQPKTFIFPVPLNIMKCFFLENKDDKNKITKWVREELYPNIPQELKNKNLFIKNGCFSNKFDFATAIPRYNTVECISECIQEIQYASFCMDTMGNSEIAIRERIGYSPNETPCIYNGLPLRNEYRVFYDFTKHKFLYIVNYWDWAYCHDYGGICSNKTDKIIYESVYDDLLKHYLANKEKVRELISDKLKSVTELEGAWSIDIMEDNGDFWLIDMALAKDSAYWRYIIFE